MSDSPTKILNVTMEEFAEIHRLRRECQYLDGNGNTVMDEGAFIAGMRALAGHLPLQPYRIVVRRDVTQIGQYPKFVPRIEDGSDG